MTASALMLGAALATQRKTSLVLPIAVLVVLVSYRPRQMVRLVPLGLVMVALIHVAAPGRYRRRRRPAQALALSPAC